MGGQQLRKRCRSARPLRRFAAGLMTGCLVVGLFYLILGIAAAWEIAFILTQVFELGKWTGEIVVLGMAVIVPIICAILAGKWRTATYGMKARKLVFSDVAGGSLGSGRYLLRVLVGMICVPLLPLSVITCLMSKQRRSIPDYLCGTVVCDADEFDGRPIAVRRDGGKNDSETLRQRQ